VFAAALATLLVVRLVERPSLSRYLGYGVAIVILGLSHVVALLLLAAHAVTVWRLRTSGRVVLGWLVAAAIAVVPVLPVLFLGSKQVGTQIQWIPEVTLRRVAETPEALVGGAVLAGAVAALALIAMSMRDSSLIATTWAFVPTAGLLAVSEVAPMWIPRYLLFTLPAWALLGSMALRNVSILRGLGAVAVIGMLAVPAQTTIRGPGGHEQATKDIAAVMTAHILPGDAVVYGGFANGDQRVSRDAVMRYVPADLRPVDSLMSRPPRTGGSFGAQECVDREVPMCLGRPQRVWVVRKGTGSDPIQGIGTAKAVLLRQSYTVQQRWQIKGFVVAPARVKIFEAGVSGIR
jgi:mannosyltransferase